VLLTKVVVRSLPFQRTTDDVTKFDPVAVSVKAPLPTAAVLGAMELNVGTGLLWAVAGPTLVSRTAGRRIRTSVAARELRRIVAGTMRPRRAARQWRRLLFSWLRLLFRGRQHFLGCRIYSGRPILSRPVRQVSAAPPTVLAVDDDPVVRECLGIVLEEHCNVVLAAGGVEALETLRSRSIDVVVLDLLMPRMSGHETLTQMHRAHAGTPVIVLTAVTDVSVVVSAMKNGAWDYVTKPWDDEALVALVHRAAREGRRERGVLLVSESVAALVPLQLALQRQTHVLATNITQALRCLFLPTAIVLECAPARAHDTVRSLEARFPSTPVIVVESNSIDAVTAELARFRVIDHATELCTAVTAAVTFMAAHHDDPLTVREIAEVADLSEGRLAHIFPAKTGFSVKDYMTRLRVSIAQRLLLETTDTVDAIAARAGYADASNFSRTFKSIGGSSPGEFRRSRKALLGPT
jgi:FixJ family two-component response regulator/AraC-like DNA-binding protein